MTAALMNLKDISHNFLKPNGDTLPILEHISLTLSTGEIVGLIGRSGCGKSTLLRIIAGLINPTRGEMNYYFDEEAALRERRLGVAMVFQSFALFPWMTVYENVALGLESLGTPAAEIKQRVLEAIDLIGLDGFQSAYPRELSGGMKQRVGFARALVMKPELLLLDEPFSALDIMTTETLRNDIIDLWAEGKLPLKSLLLVTHSIEEAVLMCDRVIILEPNPGRIGDEVRIELPHPRDRHSLEVQILVESLYSKMTHATLDQGAHSIPTSHEIGRLQYLPNISPNQITGLLEALADTKNRGQAALSALGRSLHTSPEKLLKIIEMTMALKFVTLETATAKITAAGRHFVESSILERKHVFAIHVLREVPLAAYIQHTLKERADSCAPRSRFLAILEDHMASEQAEELLDSVINLGRYAELYTYHAKSQMLSLAR
jgi:NitT/TauT family transport system ATP-binding protein